MKNQWNRDQMRGFSPLLLSVMFQICFPTQTPNIKTIFGNGLLFSIRSVGEDLDPNILPIIMYCHRKNTVKANQVKCRVPTSPEISASGYRLDMANQVLYIFLWLFTCNCALFEQAETTWYWSHINVFFEWNHWVIHTSALLYGFGQTGTKFHFHFNSTVISTNVWIIW